MIKVKANVSFVGAVSMRQGEERECEKTDAIKNLIKCGHVSVIRTRKDTDTSDDENTAGGEENETKQSE